MMGKRSKERLAAAKKITDLKLETAEASRQLQEADLRIEQLKVEKEMGTSIRIKATHLFDGCI